MIIIGVLVYDFFLAKNQFFIFDWFDILKIRKSIPLIRIR